MAFTLQQTLLAFLLAAGTYCVFKIVRFLYGEWTSPLWVLPGPSNPSLLFGNMKQIWDSVRSFADRCVWCVDLMPDAGSFIATRQMGRRVRLDNPIQGIFRGKSSGILDWVCE